MTKTSATSYEIAPNLFLVRQAIVQSAPAKPVEQPVNHLAIIDCSGSMSNDLPRIREQLKRKLPKLLKDGDTLSIIWFSGRGQCGVLMEAEPVATLADLNDVNKAVDRWLRPVGMTGFKEPLEEATLVIERIGKLNKNPFALFFMSDGCDNQHPRSIVLRVAEDLVGKLASATFVEYGYYADRPLLAAMAEKAGGQLIFAEDFDKYEPMFESAMSKHPVGGKRIEVKIEGDVIGGFAWTMVTDGSRTDSEIVVYEANGKALISADVHDLYYLSPTSAGEAAGTVASILNAGHAPSEMAPLYAALSLFAVRMKPEVVYPILKALGDVTFIDAFSICFGKQKYSEFMDKAKAAAFDPSLRYTRGYDPNKVPPDDAFTVLDLIKLLDEGDAQLLLDHPSFKYSRVSRNRVNSDENLSGAESDELEALRAKLANERSAKAIKTIQAEIDALLASKREAITFKADPAPDGYPINGLVYNEDRPNISLRVKKTGTVDLTERAASDPMVKNIESPLFKTFIYRNYTIIKDGLVNIDKLPVKISWKAYEAIREAGVETLCLFPASVAESFELKNGVPTPTTVALKQAETVTVVINVKPLPIINRKMVKAVSAEELIRLQYDLTQARAAQKVYNHYQASLFPATKLVKWTDQYGEEATAWLKDQGLTEYSGFSPKMVQAAATDAYMGKELTVALKGYSTLPSVEKLHEMLATKKKLNGPSQLMADIDAEVVAFFKKNPKNLHEAWLTGQAKATTAKTRGFIYQIAQIKFAVIVSQSWFREFKSLDENTLTVSIDGQSIVGTLELREIEIKV